MSNNNIELTRRRVLGGIATIGAASAAVGAGTFAAFSDTEESSGNTVTAGTLDLQLNPSNGSASTPISFTDIAPGDSGYLALELENEGNVNANLIGVNIGDTSEGFSNSLRTDTDGTNSEFPDPDSTSGELDNNLEVDVFIEAGSDFDESDGTSQSGTIVRSGTETNVVSSETVLANALGENSVSDSLNPGTTRYLVINYTLPSETGNAVQGDSVEFDVQVLLKQA